MNLHFRMVFIAETCFSKRSSNINDKKKNWVAVLFLPLFHWRWWLFPILKPNKHHTIISALPELLKHVWRTQTAKHKNARIHSPKWHIMNNLCGDSERPFKTIKRQTTRHILNASKRLPNKHSNDLFLGTLNVESERARLYCLSVVAASCPWQTEAQV